MLKTLIINETFYETRFKNREEFDSYIIETKENSLSEYYDNLPKLLEKFNRSPNFQKKIDEIKNSIRKSKLCRSNIRRTINQTLRHNRSPKIWIRKIYHITNIIHHQRYTSR